MIKTNHLSVKVFVLVALISVELFVGLKLISESKTKALKGALAKEGPKYVLRWLNDDKTVETKIFKSPLMAMAFAQSELQLVPGQNPLLENRVEHVWLRKEMGKQVMLWKTVNWASVNRLTFQNEQHANLFVSAFKQGAYSPSPLGHAIYLIPN